MEILGNFIMDEEIIGISSLWRKNSTDQIGKIYGAFSMEFCIFTKSNIVTITSPTFEKDTASHVPARWQAHYVQCFKQIWDMKNPENRMAYPYNINNMQKSVYEVINKADGIVLEEE